MIQPSPAVRQWARRCSAGGLQPLTHGSVDAAAACGAGLPVLTGVSDDLFVLGVVADLERAGLQCGVRPRLLRDDVNWRLPLAVAHRKLFAP